MTEDFGRNCLIARRMLERGVRFVQAWSGSDNGFPRRNSDSHENLEKDHAAMAASMDKPAAALIKDLKARGMLEDTIVHWATEFRRMPSSPRWQRPRSQPVRIYRLVCRRRLKAVWAMEQVMNGPTKSRSTRRADTTCTPPCCTCLGIDHTRLTYRHNGIDRLTDVYGQVIPESLARANSCGLKAPDACLL